MPLNIADESMGQNRLQASNSGGIEIGPSAAGSSLTVMGKQILDGSLLSKGIVPPAGVNRITGTVTITSRVLATVTVGAVSGFGKVSGAILVGFDSGTFSAALKTSASGVVQNCNYSVF